MEELKNQITKAHVAISKILVLMDSATIKFNESSFHNIQIELSQLTGYIACLEDLKVGDNPIE